MKELLHPVSETVLHRRIVKPLGAIGGLELLLEFLFTITPRQHGPGAAFLCCLVVTPGSLDGSWRKDDVSTATAGPTTTNRNMFNNAVNMTFLSWYVSL